MSSNPLEKYKNSIEIDENLLLGLTPRKSKFVRALFLNGFNQTQAAITAGYTPTNAEKRGSELLKDEQIKAVIAKVRKDTAESLAWTPDKMVAELDDNIAMARQKGQMTAVAQLLKLKGTATGTIVERMDLNVQQKGHLIIQVPDFKAPDYAKEAIDVTVTKLIEKKKDGT